MTDETQEPTAQELQDEAQAGTNQLKEAGESIPTDVTEKGAPAILSYVRARIAAIEEATVDAAIDSGEQEALLQQQEGSEDADKEPTLQELADELTAGTERLQGLGEAIPPAVTVRGAVAILAYVRDRLAALDAEAVEREREAQDEAAAESVVDVIVDPDADAEHAAEPELSGGQAVADHGLKPEPAGDAGARAVRAESLGDAIHELATISGILASIEQYILWAGETIEDLHKRTARLGSTIEHVPDRQEIADAAGVAETPTDGAEPGD